jgi:hypothetical protein
MAVWVSPLRGLGATAAGVSFDSGATEAYALEPAGYPFLFTPDLIWTSLTGETLAAWPYRKVEADALPDRVKAICDAAPGGASNNCDRGWYMFPDNADLYMKNSANRAFEAGKRWVHRTGHGITGADSWSVAEASVIRGFILIIDDWITELRSSEALLKSAPRYAPAYGAMQIAVQELLAAKGALDALQRACRKVASYDQQHDAILDVREAAAWYNGALDYVKAAQMTIGVGDFAVDVDDIIENVAGIQGELGDMLAFAADNALRRLYDSVSTQVVQIGEKIVAQIGLDISKKTIATITPYVQQFVTAVVGAYESLDREKPGYINWARGALAYTRQHLDTYGHMMYRVMQQHRKRVAAVRAGRVTWTETAAAPGLRPESNRAVEVRRTEEELNAIAAAAFARCASSSAATKNACMVASVKAQAPELSDQQAAMLLYIHAGAVASSVVIDVGQVKKMVENKAAGGGTTVVVAGAGAALLLWWLLT